MTESLPASQSEPNVDSQPRTELLRQLQQLLFRTMDALIIHPDADSQIVELPILQVKCLHIIARDEGQKLVDVAQKLGVSLPGVSRIVDRLVRHGMVERHLDPNDRRALQLGLTERARTTLKQARSLREAQLEHCTQSLDAVGLQQIIAALDLLVTTAETAKADEKK